MLSDGLQRRKRRMSALGQKRTCAAQKLMSALLPLATAKADIRWWMARSKALLGGVRRYKNFVTANEA